MREDISCQIIQDLLPNYIEGMVSNESNELVKAHIDKCVFCKKEWEYMNTLIYVDPIEERKIDYLKGIHKKSKNILLLCIILSCIIFVISVFYSEANNGEAIFTLVLYFMIIIFIGIKFVLPLFGAIASAFLLKKTKKKWLILIFALCSCWFVYTLFKTVCSMISSVY